MICPFWFATLKAGILSPIVNIVLRILVIVLGTVALGDKGTKKNAHKQYFSIIGAVLLLRLDKNEKYR
jgi:hypothetical protein